MHTGTPNDLADRIQADADRFAASDADDPKAMVDAVMAEVEAGLDGKEGAAFADLSELTGAAQAMLEDTEGAGGTDGHARRRLLFLRSIVQLLRSRGSLGA